MRSGYRELGLKLFLHGDDCSRYPKQPPMVEKKIYDEEGDPFKMLLEEALA
jgi:hypothetical protein